VLTPAEEAIVVAFRQKTLMPLDDVLGCLRDTIPNLSRSALHRCLQRHVQVVLAIPVPSSLLPPPHPLSARPSEGQAGNKALVSRILRTRSSRKSHDLIFLLFIQSLTEHV
jgi:hypothetical protein